MKFLEFIKKRIFIVFLVFSLPIVLLLVGIIFIIKSTEVSISINKLAYSSEQQFDNNLLSGFQYEIPGRDGQNINIQRSITIFNKKIVIQNSSKNVYAINTIKFVGNNDINTVKDSTKKNVNNLLQIIKSGDINTLISVSDFKNEQILPLSNNSKLDNIYFSDLNVSNTNTISNNVLKVGSISLKLNNCNKNASLTLIYFTDSKKYGFNNINDFLNQLCPKVVEPPILATCTDCTLFPVDKQHALPESYVPVVTFIDSIPGGQQFSVKAKNDLIDMYIAATKSGNTFRLTSGYRSYKMQIDTFNAWVQTEIQKGLDRASAIIAANTYSAYPGHSEHQLGTTVDLSSLHCLAFDTVCTENVNLRNWMAANSYLYGFVLSYPKDKQNLTGYVYEPWHYRWIGKDLAKQFHQVESQTYLYEFLKTQMMY